MGKGFKMGELETQGQKTESQEWEMYLRLGELDTQSEKRDKKRI